MAKADERMILPALRGRMGDWVYYSALIPMGELSKRVKYAHELRKRDERAMSDFIQRALGNQKARLTGVLINDAGRNIVMGRRLFARPAG